MIDGQLISAKTGQIIGDPPPPPTLEQKRATASLNRVPFLKGMVTLGVFTQDTAVEAADGTWPTALNTLLSSMPFDDKLAVKDEWKRNDLVPYGGLVMQTVAAYTQTEQSPVVVSQAQLDTLFGVTV